MADEKRITGRHVLFAMIAFFGVIIVVNVIFITLAVKSFPGEAEKKSYMQGLNYNDVLIARAEQEALGWTAAITRVEQTGSGGVLELQITDVGGRALSTLQIEGVLKRPAHAGDDIELTFERLGDGAYRATTPTLRDGAWDLEAQAEGGADERLDISSRIIVR